MRGGGEGSVGVIGAGTSDWLREYFYNVEMQRERPGRQGLRNLQPGMTAGCAKRFTARRRLFWERIALVPGRCHSERRREAPEARNRDRPDRGLAPLPGRVAIPRLRAFGPTLGMTTCR